jgi:hypothetical protein
MNCQFIWKFEYIYVVRGTWCSLSRDSESDSSLGLCCANSRCHVKTLGSWGLEFDAWSVLYAYISADGFKALSVAKLIFQMCGACLLCLQFRAHGKCTSPLVHHHSVTGDDPHIRNEFCILAYLYRGPKGQYRLYLETPDKQRQIQ